MTGTKSFIAFFIFFVNITPAQSNASVSEEILVSGNENGSRLDKNFSIWHNPDQKATLDQAIVAHQRGEFKPLLKEDSTGLLPGALWSHFVLTNSTDESVEIDLEYVDHQIRFIDAHFREMGYRLPWEHISLSLDNPFKERKRIHHRFVIPVEIAPHTSMEFFIRFQGTQTVFFYPNLRLWAPENLSQVFANETIAIGIFSGGLSIIAVIAFVVGIATRDKAFTLYGLYSLFVICAWFTITGYTHMFIVRENFTTAYMSVTAGFGLFFSAWFSRSFLYTAKYLPKIDWLLKAMMLNAVVLVVSGALGQFKVAVPSITIGMLSYFVIIAAGFMRSRQGNLEARVFTLAWMLLVIGMFEQVMRDLGFVPHNFFTYYFPILANFLEMITILFAIGYRVHHLRKSKQALANRYTQHLLRSKEELKLLVLERTRDLEQEKLKAEKEARIDALTNIYNRRYFFEQAAISVSIAASSNIPTSILMFDIDFFKSINDRYGHAGGDAALVEFANAIREQVRDEDVFGRLGGEEFCLLLTNNTEEQAQHTAERLKEIVSQLHIKHDNQVIKITTSIGVAQVRVDESLDCILNRADEALYAAKNSGRNQVIFAS